MMLKGELGNKIPISSCVYLYSSVNEAQLDSSMRKLLPGFKKAIF